MKHAIYSGREFYMTLPSHLQVDYENATSWVLPGDLGYGFIEGGRWSLSSSNLYLISNQEEIRDKGSDEMIIEKVE